MMSRIICVAFGMAITSWLSLSQAQADCICRYKGGEITHGQTACVPTPHGKELARCEKVLNMASWKFLGQPCPTAANDHQPISLRAVVHLSAG